jgi:hypothetical protein
MELMEVGTKNSKLNLEVAKAKLLDWKNEIKYDYPQSYKLSSLHI